VVPKPQQREPGGWLVGQPLVQEAQIGRGVVPDGKAGGQRQDPLGPSLEVAPQLFGVEHNAGGGDGPLIGRIEQMGAEEKVDGTLLEAVGAQIHPMPQIQQGVIEKKPDLIESTGMDVSLWLDGDDREVGHGVRSGLFPQAAGKQRRRPSASASP
jgi:hypothetical protein